jgi:hypothetical protein
MAHGGSSYFPPVGAIGHLEVPIKGKGNQSFGARLRHDRHRPCISFLQYKCVYQTLQPHLETRTWSPSEPSESRAGVGVALPPAVSMTAITAAKLIARNIADLLQVGWIKT